VVTDLTGSEVEQDRLASLVTDGVQLGVQAALCPSQTTGKAPFCAKLAAVRWAFRCVASIMIRSGFLPAVASHEDTVKYAEQAPADKTIVKGLVRAIRFRSVLPLQAVLDHVDDPTDHPAIIDPRHTVRERKKWRYSRHLALAQQEQLGHGKNTSAMSRITPQQAETRD
jgi:hypothetical protein